MMRPAIFPVVVLLAMPAFADMYQDASNSKLPEARTNLGLGTTDNVTFNRLLLNPAARVFNTSIAPALQLDLTASGAPTSGSAWLNVIDTVDNVDASGIGNALSMLYLLNIPGPQAKGQRSTLHTQIALNNTTADAAPNANFYTGHQISASATANQGGTASVPNGIITGGSIETTIGAGATHFVLAEAAEYGVRIDPGSAPPLYVQTLQLSPNGCGSQTCAGLTFGGHPTDGFRYDVLLSFNSSVAGSKGWKDTGTLIGTYYPVGTATPMPAAYGIDLTKFAFSQAALKTNGLTIDGAGRIIATAMPTNCTGAPSKMLWSDAGTVKVCP